MKSFHELYEKYKDLIPYAIFGVFTTVVNMVVYWFCSHVLHMPTLVSTLIAWLLAVFFAYVTNRKWVFHSEAVGRKEILREAVSFYAARVATEVIDLVCMFVFVDCLHFNDVVIKFLANVLVIIVNYVLSKLVIFKKKKKPEEEEEKK